ncbi:probable RNA-directed DNA polymerase from transposon X-element [Trichonephila clavipes]|nr:probable RNA-directed DNA polymerase from transposon X-element [Trichonephila clavipes]
MAHNKQLKVVLRGLPTDFNHGFKPNHVSLLRNRKTNTNMPLFLVTLPKSPESRGIFNIKNIGFFRVAVEPLNKSTMPPQCYRCQEFFHHSRFCARAPKCLKCSGGHLTSECTKSAKAPAKCANCSGPHPANFSGCPKNPINTKPNKKKPTKNVWQERAAARKDNKKQPTTPSFAEVVKRGTNNNSLDAKEVMTQMAQMMSKWGQMLWNANGLKSNLEELKDCIIDYNPDVIGIQETHLRPADRVSIPNYTCHRSDRTTHRGGGTALFVKNSVSHHTILNVSNTFENSSVILQIGNNSKITVACIYRPPHDSINTTELDAILNHSNKAFLFGDFNARHPSWNPGRANTNGNILCNWAVGSALDILAPDTPTHFNSRHSNAILDIGFAVNLSYTEVFTINTLSNDLDLAVQNLTSNISNAISASTSTRLINTPHFRLPENIRELIRAKNRFSKLWNDTRYPPYKREVNALIRQIRSEIQEHKNRTWKDYLLTLNPEDNSLYNLHRKFSIRHIPFPPLHGPGGMAYSDFEKAEAFKDTLEVTFQENEEPYCDDKIEEV